VHRQPLQPPSTDRDLVAAARNNRVLAFDNVSKLSREMADNFCRLSTGGEIGGRALFTDHDTASFSALRPIVLNGIPDLTTHGDLADRSIVLRLRPLATRLSEQEWWSAIEGVLPSVFAGLLNALSHALRSLVTTTVVTPNTRMADFAKFVVAAEPALPWPDGGFMGAYGRSRQNVSASLLDGDVVADAVRKFMEDHQPVWTGTMSELYGLLTPATASRPLDWPGNAARFSSRLRRAAPTLRALGIDSHDRRTGPATEVTLRKLAAQAT
jgi:putative DNA primase/helicase